MNESWLSIWQKRRLTAPGLITLPQLIALDGFDGFGGIEESAWLTQVDRIAGCLGIRPGDSLFEVGCGGGAFLSPFYLRGHKVGGIDYAENLVAIASQMMPEADVRVVEAALLDTSIPYDVVTAHGVFFYFPGLDYAATVLHRMVEKADRAIGVFDVPDLAWKETALKLRQGSLGAEEYAQKYRGLDHLYFSRDWFLNTLHGLDLDVQIENQSIPGYFHNSYRFNVFIRKPEAGR